MEKEFIYIVMAHRYGDHTGHSYFISYTRELEIAKNMAHKENEDSNGKYSGVVYKVFENENYEYQDTEVYRAGM